MPRWSEKDLQFLRDNVGKLSHKEIAAHLGRSPGNIKSQTANLRLFGKRFRFSVEQIEILKAEYPTRTAKDLAAQFGCTEHAIHNKAMELKIRKSSEWIAERTRQVVANPAHPGRRTRFQKGCTPHNKGKKMPTVGRMAETQFKSGNLPPTTLPVGAMVIDDEGYTKIKIAMPNNWQFYQRYLWERQTGEKIRPGFVVVFKDGDRKNFALDNLEMISRSELARRNKAKFDDYPLELRQAIYALAWLKRRINRKTKKKNA